MNDFEPKQFGKYFLLQKIAVGGMAEIYKAKTFGVDGFEKQLVIKRILPHCSADKDFITMLIDEAKLSVLLSHANIVQVYDLGKVADDYYISMEFIHGVNLRDTMYYCRENKKAMPADISAYIISEICKGLDYAHRKTDQNNQTLNIVHRDISPQNILISYEGEVKIVDFGIAKAAMNISHTMAGILKGKIAYMSPEQAMGKKIDRRTDIFSTGILLYEMLTNSKLFTGESQFEILKKIRTTRITKDKLPDSIPAVLKPIVAKALAYNVDDRYQNAGDIQIELTKFLYSTYSDFSPRKLAAFIADLFERELNEEQTALAREAKIEQMTSSVSFKERAKQMDIVHRGDSYTPVMGKAAVGEKPEKEEISTTATPIRDATVRTEPPQPSITKAVRKEKGRRRSVVRTIAPVIALAAAVLVAFKFIPELQFWKGQATPEPPDEVSAPTVEEETARFGSVSVTSEPSDANVFLDGKDTGRRTPAILEELSIGKNYSLRVEKENYGPAEKTISITSPDKIDANLILAEPKGVLNIITDPVGAAVILDGRLTGLTTPAVIEDLPIGKDRRITLSKPGYEDFEQVINLTSVKPQRISTKLNAIAPQTGTLSIDSTPKGASILLDGNDTEKITPATIAGLKPKRYALILKLTGYRQWSGDVDVAADKTAEASANLVKIEEPTEKPPTTEEPLVEETKVPAEKTPVVEEKPREEAKKPTEPRKKPEKEIAKKPAPTPTPPEITTPVAPPPTAPTGYGPGAKPGKIKITSNPSGADVFINAELKGQTPITVSFPPGTAHILVNKEGLAKYSKSVAVRPGETVNLTGIALGELYGQVTFSSTPPKAQVVFDGKAIPARTPVTIKKVRVDRQHTVTVQLSGYQTWSTTFSMEGETKKAFNITLQPQ